MGSRASTPLSKKAGSSTKAKVPQTSQAPGVPSSGCASRAKAAKVSQASLASGVCSSGASRSSLQVGALPKVRLVQAVSSLSSGGAPSAKVPQASLASGARSSCAIQARKRARSFFASEVSGQVAARSSSQVGACRRPRCRRLLQASLLIGRLRRNALLALAMPGAREAATLLTSSSDAGARSRSVAGCRLCPFRRKLRSKLRGRCEIMLPGSTRRHRLLLTLSLGRPRSSLLWLAVPLEMQIL